MKNNTNTNKTKNLFIELTFSLALQNTSKMKKSFRVSEEVLGKGGVSTVYKAKDGATKCTK